MSNCMKNLELWDYLWVFKIAIHLSIHMQSEYDHMRIGVAELSHLFVSTQLASTISVYLAKLDRLYHFFAINSYGEGFSADVNVTDRLVIRAGLTISAKQYHLGYIDIFDPRLSCPKPRCYLRVPWTALAEWIRMPIRPASLMNWLV